MPARPFAKAVVKKLVEAGHVAYFAGGCVRDDLMGHASDDIDIATDASAQEVQALFPKTIPVGVAFGIVVVVHEGHQFEVATFRKESGYLDGRRPTSIERASPEEDAKRRDFTINGMFWDPLEENLYDFVGGREDIQAGVLRAIGDPHERFLEDRLRMMRAVRYATRFGFAIDLPTESAIRSHAQALLPAVAMERVWQEFKKMSRFAHFNAGLLKLHELGLLAVIFPKLQGVGLDAIEKRLSPLSCLPPNMPALWELSYLFPGETTAELMELCEYLKVSCSEKQSVEFLHRTRALFNLPAAWTVQLENLEWVRLYAHPESDRALLCIAAALPQEHRETFLGIHGARRRELAPFIERVVSKSPLIRAEKLIQEGIVPGKQLGLLLEEAERIHINQGIEDPDRVIFLLKRSPLWHERL
jgi:poly(A) polymerase